MFFVDAPVRTLYFDLDMTQEEKQLLLLKELCARLPYGVMIEITSDGGMVEASYDMRLDAGLLADLLHREDDFKPYLRPMSSITEEEKENLQSLHNIISDENYGDGYSPSAWDAITEWEDYCNSRHLDYRGLIKKGLALEAHEGMYKTE